MLSPATHSRPLSLPFALLTSCGAPARALPEQTNSSSAVTGSLISLNFIDKWLMEIGITLFHNLPSIPGM